MAIDPQILAKALLDQKLLNEKEVENLLKQANTKEISLEKVLFEREMLSEEKLNPILASLYGVEAVDLSEINISDVLLRIVPYALASNQLVIPFENDGTVIKVATSSPDNEEIKSLLEKKINQPVKFYYASPTSIKIALKAYNKDVNEKFNKLLESVLKNPKKIESLKDAAKILDTIILFGYQNKASDIHIEPHKSFLIIRYRIDGILQTIAELPLQLMDLITTRIKVLANMRTDEHRAAQDGRFKIELENNEITMRVSIVPTYDGEKTVLRLLSATSQGLNLEAMGYSQDGLRIIKRNMLKTHGMILVTGPTGSGKTTTLYSILRILNSPEINLATIEDPIEYRLEGTNQIQVNAKTNLTFANGLRALLRQDPNVIMVGEIRDEETASIAVNAALTGHLVLATLHTNDAATTLPRMKEMGVEPFLLGATVQMIIAQRLVRTICEKCKTQYTLEFEKLQSLREKFNVSEDLKAIVSELGEKNPQLKQAIAENKMLFHKGEGCAACGGSGFKGRVSVSEILEVSDEIKKLLLAGASPTDILNQAKKEGMVTMFSDGMRKALEGQTTIEEILRVMRS